MKYIDDETKKLYRWNRNYFFAGTIAIALFVLIFGAFIGALVKNFTPSTDNNWNHILDFNYLILAVAKSFLHKNGQHAWLNMLCFFICGIWLERRKGTLPFVLLVFIMTILTAAFIAGNHQSLNYRGFSGVNFGLYAYAIIDYCFLFRKETRTKFNVISGAVLMAFIYLHSCFDGGVRSFSFTWYPYDFLTNLGHYSSFLAGAILGLTVQFVKLTARKEAKKE